MPQQRGQSTMGRLHTCTGRHLPQVHPQRQGIDEHPQRPVGAFAALHPTHQHGAEHHIVAARHTAQHLRPGQMDQARDTHAEPAGLNLQVLAQAAGERQRSFLDALSRALHIVQAKRQRRLVHLTEHVAEEALVLLLADTQASLGHIVAIRHRLRQLPGLPEQVRLHLLAHHFQRRVVEGHMVEQQGRDPALVACILGKTDAHQRRLADIQAMVPGIEARLQLSGDVAVLIPQRHLFDAQRSLAPDHLHRLVQPFPGHGRAQDVMAIDHALQGLGEVVQAFAAVEGELCLQHVGVALFGREVVIEDPLLQRRHRIDVLHVGRATRHGRDDAVDGVLGQRYQWQQGRGDVLAIRRNQVGRDIHLVALADGRCQRRQGRLIEQDTHVGTQAGLAHPLDQADGQQRVAAEFEEVIMTADTLDLEQVLPDLRQGGFDFALGGFVAAGGQCLVFRGRQGLAVEFAVGGQW
ncbi:hypothetical protein SRABI112_01677 [Pseudomonas mediterranea]|nr:hypothetical protein SRABI112_01677 [Pseudomonas mediterranea]